MAITNPIDVSAFTTQKIIERAVNIKYKSNGLWFKLLKKGERWDGGTQIEAPLFDGAVLAVQWYQDRETWVLPNNRMNVNAVYQLREAVGQVSVSGRDDAINRGKPAALNFINMKTAHVKAGLSDMFGTAIQGSNAGGKEFDGGGLLFSATSTYGGLAPADVPDWIAQIRNATANTMTDLELQIVLGRCTQGDTRPDLIVSNQACYDKFSTFGTAAQVIIDQELASIGVRNQSFRGIPWLVDSHTPGSGAGSTDNVVQFWNTGYFQMWTCPGWNFKQVAHPQLPNEDVKRISLLYKGNGVCQGRPYFGQLAQLNPAL